MVQIDSCTLKIHTFILPSYQSALGHNLTTFKLPYPDICPRAVECADSEREDCREGQVRRVARRRRGCVLRSMDAKLFLCCTLPLALERECMVVAARDLHDAATQLRDRARREHGQCRRCRAAHRSSAAHRRAVRRHDEHGAPSQSTIGRQVHCGVRAVALDLDRAEAIDLLRMGAVNTDVSFFVTRCSL